MTILNNWQLHFIGGETLTNYVTNQNKVRFPFVPKSGLFCQNKTNGIILIQSEAYNAAYIQKHFLVPGCGTEAAPTPHFAGEDVVGLCVCACERESVCV